ncbi:MAG: hypothetical protein U0L26_04500 [Cellulosilyticum sp.]|nr:hypothetical protein [Cellulosilyticum sp.]
MSNPKFLVFKLKDLRIPALILLIVVALFIFFIFQNKTTTTFSPSNGYGDGKYIAGITLSDADMDLVVEVKDNNIVSISLSGLDETSSTLYKDLVSSIDYINTYVTATQSLELPQNGDTTTATMLLMDAVKVALSNDANASLQTTYEKVNLTPNESAETDSLAADPSTTDIEASNSTDDASEVFVDEFQEEDFPTSIEDTTLENESAIE